MTLEELKAAIEAEALTRQAAREGFTMAGVKAFLEVGRAVPPPPQQPLTFAYFKSLNGKSLVSACFTNLLGRSPDPVALEHYSRLLSQGEDKALVVGRIAYSPEGRMRKVPIVGLFSRVAIAAAKKVPVLGSVFAWLVALLTLHLRQREERIFEQQMSARMDAVGEYLGQASTQISMRIEALRAVMQDRE